MPDNEIEEKLKQIHQLLAECTQIADKEGTWVEPIILLV